MWRPFAIFSGMPQPDRDAPPIEISELTRELAPGLSIEHRRIPISESLFLVLFQGKGASQRRIIHRFRNGAPHVGFNFCLEGKTSFALSGGYPTAFAGADKVNNFLMPACEVTQEIGLQPGISLATLYVDLAAFRKMMGGSLEVAPLRLLEAMEQGSKCYFESYRWQATVKAVLFQIFQVRMSPLAQRIFIESKALELIAIILDLYSKGDPAQFSLSRSDVERIHYAREILLRDLANPPSLSKLAREAGTNEFTLKKGFKEVFEAPVFKYLQQTRLAKAYELFQSTNLQVSEVAGLVGYESVSSFTRAFQAQYGLNPGEVKRIPFRTI
jgi:AraC family transcriptional activator of pyochelin receptor